MAGIGWELVREMDCTVTGAGHWDSGALKLLRRPGYVNLVFCAEDSGQCICVPSGNQLGPPSVCREIRAGVAQLVEHLICNQTVGGSNPFASSMSIGTGSLLSGLQGLDFGSFGLGSRESGRSRRGNPGSSENQASPPR